MTVLRHPNNQGVTLQQWRKTAAGGETSLTGTDDFSAALAYTVGAEEVFINGVLIERGVDYTATSGTSITLTNALVAGDLATVQSATSFNVANAIPKATVTAKGDLITATGASTVTNLAVGADGSTLVANSSASTGVSWAGPSVTAGKNGVINGAMEIAQRGTSAASASGVYYGFTCDRWRWQYSTANAGLTVTQQSAGSTLPQFKYCQRAQRNSGVTATYGIYLSQSLETLEATRFAGQTVTLSFYARAGANYSAGSNALAVGLNTGTGTDENILNGYTGSTTVINSNATLTTSWQRFTFTGSIPSTATELGFYFYHGPTGTAGAADYFEVTGVQLEVGSVVTAFSRAGGTLQGELAACQRYYRRFSGTQSGNGYFYIPAALAGATSSTGGYLDIALNPQMRVPPTSITFTAGGIYVAQPNDTRVNPITGLSFTNANTEYSLGASFTVSGGLTTNTWHKLQSPGTSSNYLDISAEL